MTFFLEDVNEIFSDCIAIFFHHGLLFACTS